MSSQGWRSWAASPPLLHTGGLGSRGSVFAGLCSPSQQKQPASRCPPAHTPEHPATRWSQSPDSQPHSSRPAMWLWCPLPPPRMCLPQGCWCDSDQGVHTSVPNLCRTTLVVLHKVRAAQTGPTLIPSIPLTGAVSRLSSALISTHLAFH